MKTAAIVLGVLIVIAGGALVVLRGRARGSRSIEGLSRHRAHMDALSSDARREVIERVQDARRDEWEGD
jgi:hypothetical protein